MVVTTVMRKVESGLAAALAALGADAGASPVLVAVVEEFDRKFRKTRAAIEAEDAGSREALVELEQAADSARYAALADAGALVSTRDVIVDTHDWVCTFKATGELLRPE